MDECSGKTAALTPDPLPLGEVRYLSRYATVQ